jgi:hypothetical protein
MSNIIVLPTQKVLRHHHKISKLEYQGDLGVLGVLFWLHGVAIKGCSSDAISSVICLTSSA